MSEENIKEVICVDKNSFLDITVGNKYTVTKELDYEYEIRDDCGCIFKYNKNLFKPVLKSKTDYKQKTKVMDVEENSPKWLLNKIYENDNPAQCLLLILDFQESLTEPQSQKIAELEKKGVEKSEKIEGWINYGSSLQRKIDNLEKEVDELIIHEDKQSSVIGKYYGKYLVSEEENTNLKEQLEGNLRYIENKRAEWSLKTFTEATAFSSLIKAREEIEEIEVNLKNGVDDPVEYADALMCVFDAAKRDGIDYDQVISAYAKKVYININDRTWIKNDDNTYSHVK